jgi:hypothetical protein
MVRAGDIDLNSGIACVYLLYCIKETRDVFKMHTAVIAQAEGRQNYTMTPPSQQVQLRVSCGKSPMVGDCGVFT